MDLLTTVLFQTHKTRWSSNQISNETWDFCSSFERLFHQNSEIQKAHKDIEKNEVCSFSSSAV